MSNTIRNIYNMNTQLQNSNFINLGNNAAATKRVHINANDFSKILSAGKVTIDGVELELSDEAVKVLEDAQKAREERKYKQEIQENMQTEKENAEAEKDAFLDLAKLMEIARRISRGDKVPLSDEKKLMEYDGDLYQIAKQTSILNANKKHKKYDSMFDEEEETNKKPDDTETVDSIGVSGVDIELSVADTNEDSTRE